MIISISMFEKRQTFHHTDKKTRLQPWNTTVEDDIDDIKN